MSDKRDQLLAVIDSDLRQDVTDFRALRELMQGLYEHLLQRDTPHIERLNQQITDLLEQVGLRAQRRVKVLGAFRLSGDGAGMNRLLALYPATRRSDLQQQWTQLEQLIGECKRLNERNGKLLAMHNDVLNQLLADLGDGSLYGFSGY